MLGPCKSTQNRLAVLVVQHHQKMSSRTFIFRVRMQNNSVQRFLCVYTYRNQRNLCNNGLAYCDLFQKYPNLTFFIITKRYFRWYNWEEVNVHLVLLKRSINISSLWCYRHGLRTLLILRVFSTVINNLSQMKGRTLSSCLTVIYIIQYTHFYLTKNMAVLPLITTKPFTNS